MPALNITVYSFGLCDVTVATVHSSEVSRDGRYACTTVVYMTLFCGSDGGLLP